MTRQRWRLALPGALLASLALLVAHHLASRWQTIDAAPSELPAPPAATMLRAVTLDNPEFACRLLLVYLQSHELRPGQPRAMARLDYERVVDWLDLALRLDPESAYPLLLASHVYAGAGTPAQTRMMMDFVYRAFLERPDQRWPALAQTALLARHRLQDTALALEFAKALTDHVPPGAAPPWVRQMSLLLLSDIGEREAARALFDALVASGEISDTGEFLFLARRLGITVAE